MLTFQDVDLFTYTVWLTFIIAYVSRYFHIHIFVLQHFHFQWQRMLHWPILCEDFIIMIQINTIMIFWQLTHIDIVFD